MMQFLLQMLHIGLIPKEREITFDLSESRACSSVILPYRTKSKTNEWSEVR